MRQVLVGQRFAIRIIEIVKLNYCMQCFEKYEQLKSANDIKALRAFLEANSKNRAETVQSKKARAIVSEFDKVSGTIYKTFQHFVQAYKNRLIKPEQPCVDQSAAKLSLSSLTSS